MGIATSEKDLAGRVARFLKVEMKRAGVTYAELATRLKDHGLEETEASITVLAALGLEGMSLGDL